jgi:hypothetical protein
MCGMSLRSLGAVDADWMHDHACIVPTCQLAYFVFLFFGVKHHDVFLQPPPPPPLGQSHVRTCTGVHKWEREGGCHGQSYLYCNGGVHRSDSARYGSISPSPLFPSRLVLCDASRIGFYSESMFVEKILKSKITDNSEEHWQEAWRRFVVPTWKNWRMVQVCEMHACLCVVLWVSLAPFRVCVSGSIVLYILFYDCVQRRSHFSMYAVCRVQQCCTPTPAFTHTRSCSWAVMKEHASALRISPFLRS